MARNALRAAASSLRLPPPSPLAAPSRRLHQLRPRAAASPASSSSGRRSFFWGSGSASLIDRPLVPVERVNEWMAPEADLVEQDLNVLRRSELWMTLRLLHGLELEDFLLGCRQAYKVTTHAMYSRDWATLQPLVLPACLEAMQGMMEQYSEAGQRIELPAEGEGEAFRLLSCRLCRARVLVPSEEDGIPVGSCHMHVHFVAEESFTIFDYHTNQPVPPFDGQPRQQESTWVFEGVVRAPGEELSQEAASDQAVSTDWRVRAFV